MTLANKPDAEGSARHAARAAGRLDASLGQVKRSAGVRYLAKWLPLGIAIGLSAGLGALLLCLAVEAATDLLLVNIAGYTPPSASGEGDAKIVPMTRPWLLPLTTALGGLLSGLLVARFAPEAERHGTDAAIAAIHFSKGRVRARIPLIKLLASAITIGSGGSAGRAGPAAQIGAGFASLLGRRLDLTARDRRVAVAAGIGAGVGAIFRAPLAGGVLAAEVLYLYDLEAEALLPALIASIVGYGVFGTYFGFSPVLSLPATAPIEPSQLVYFAAVGLVCGVVGVFYARAFYSVVDVTSRLRLPPWLAPALGGALVGGLGLALPQVLHTGLGWIEVSATPSVLDAPLWVVLLLPFAKILATSLAIGSGGSGGVFGPGLVAGGMLGAALWRLGYGILPNFPSEATPFVVAGMVALFGGIAHAPLAMVLLGAEITGSLTFAVPAALAVAVSGIVVGKNSILGSQLPDRTATPSHRVRLDFPLLATTLVRDAMAPTNAAWEGDLPPLRPDQPLDEALDVIIESGRDRLPVVENGRMVGEIGLVDTMTACSISLSAGERWNTATVGHAVVELRLEESSPLCGRSLAEADLPRATLVVSINRDGEIVFPQAGTRLEAGDLVTLLTERAQEETLRGYLRGRSNGGRFWPRT